MTDASCQIDTKETHSSYLWRHCSSHNPEIVIHMCQRSCLAWMCEASQSVRAPIVFSSWGTWKSQSGKLTHGDQQARRTIFICKIDLLQESKQDSQPRLQYSDKLTHQRFEKCSADCCHEYSIRFYCLLQYNAWYLTACERASTLRRQQWPHCRMKTWLALF